MDFFNTVNTQYITCWFCGKFHGGDMGQTYGVPVNEIVEGIKHGVRKVNIDTDLRMASTGAVRKHFDFISIAS
jgi:fructose/tagatose bisphosphate aldolase